MTNIELIDAKIKYLQSEAERAKSELAKWEQISFSCHGGIITLEQLKKEILAAEAPLPAVENPSPTV